MLALGASLLVVLVIVLIVPRSDAPMEPDIDVAPIAEQAQIASDDPLAVPELPEGWRANAAELRTVHGRRGRPPGTSGYLTPSDEYIGMYQGSRRTPPGSPDCSSARSPPAPPRSTASSGRSTTTATPATTSATPATPSTTEAGGSTFVLLGTATPEEFLTLATALVPTIDAQQ